MLVRLVEPFRYTALVISFSLPNLDFAPGLTLLEPLIGTLRLGFYLTPLNLLFVIRVEVLLILARLWEPRSGISATGLIVC